VKRQLIAALFLLGSVCAALAQVPQPVIQTGHYPLGAVPITASVQGTTSSSAVTLTGVAGKTTYICGFSVRSNATAAATGFATVAGVVTATMSFNHTALVNTSGMGISEEAFFPCVPASAQNTNIVVTGPAAGAGGTISVAAWGYQL
jgi:hypothetical protein